MDASLSNFESVRIVLPANGISQLVEGLGFSFGINSDRFLILRIAPHEFPEQ
jgi:hypothetical protein